MSMPYMSNTYRNSFPACNGVKNVTRRRNDYYMILDVHVCIAVGVYWEVVPPEVWFHTY